MTRRHPASLMLAALLAAGTLPVAAEKATVLRPLAAATRHLEEGFLARPKGLAYDAGADEVWVADTSNNLVGAFNPEGTPLFATNGGGTIVEPSRIAVAPDGGLWVLGIDSTRIVRLDWRGNPLPTPVLEGLPEEPVLGAIEFDEQGNLYVGENVEGRIHVFDTGLRPRFRFGSRGTEEGQFSSIADIAVTEKWIAVVDAIAKPVQLFNRRGEFERAWGDHALGAENFSLPQGIAIDDEEHVIVVDALRHEIKLFDIKGRFLGRFGGRGFGPGQVRFPSDVAVDPSGRLYVAERGNARIQVFAIEEIDVPDRSSPGRSRPRRR